ncbi:hypothetical protein DWB61_05060 [Ancylomarina euxinus]|uniref:Uncharacterized protein n=1 Tax=Ancylomarina euxinus TaxID=2283627 RepID=A0A425Y5H7_9BACT|nr:PD40 domain-containing protein [Ancylomarina euxinus]MCZ4694220.1 PD40 domain-containing protein [Ancylomarina euxinus]MUP14449.1 hypothetical protein [Ancylomarina euxinus]RRG23752.1 hypothetical protein DWB61_05060 [Ancylomarina euxinus]
MLKLNSGIHKKTSTQLLRTFLFFIIIAIGVNTSFASNSLSTTDKTSKRKKTKMATMYFANKNYGEAAPVLYDLLLLDRKNADLNNMLGVCYFNLESEKEKSTEYLEKAIRYTKSKNNIPLAYYYNLGKSYHINYQFSKAIRTYNNLLNLVPRGDVEYITEIEREIEICRNAIQLTENPVNITVENLGNSINTEYAEHSPGVTADETTMVFTSRRNGTGSKVDKDGQFFEDIYISQQVNGVWSEPKGISILNTKDHDASISISADGQEIYVYKAGYYNNNESNGGDIYVSKLNGENWTRPQKLHSDINSPSKESHISISSDGRTIYFSSDRPGGYGKMDIYSVKKLPNGKWGPAQNLGPNINTIYDDEAPFIHHDGINLYFSSKGHKTMGGFDVFKSTFENGRWTKPVNVGFPINSTKEDIYYTPTPDGKRAYMASYRKGSYGRADIFRIQTPDADNTGLFVLKGKLINTKGEPVGNARIKLSLDNKTIGLYRPNTASGKFLFIIDAGKQYNLEIRAEGYRPMSTVMNVPAEYANKENHSVITLLPLALHREDEEDYPADMDLIDYEASKISLEKEAITPEIDNKLEDPELKDPLKVVPPIEEPVEEKKIKETKPEVIIKKDIPVIVPVAKTPNAQVKLEKQNIDSIPSLEPLFFTIELNTSDTSILAKLKEIPGIEEVKNPENNLSYIQGRFENYKDAVKAKELFEKKGLKKVKIRMIQHNTIIKELEKEANYYTIQILALQIPMDPEMFNYLDNVKIFQSSDGFSRYTYKKFRSFTAANQELNRLIRIGYWDSFIRTVINGELIYPEMKFSTSTAYTIQLMSLKEVRPVSYFKNLKGVNVYRDSENIYRYTYKIFPTKSEAQLALGEVLKKSYWDAYVRKAYWGEEVLFANYNTRKSNKYTIQIMALNHPKSLNYFNNLPADRLNMNKGKDGLSRYTFEAFEDKKDEKTFLNIAFKKGYYDAFTRTIKWYNKN